MESVKNSYHCHDCKKELEDGVTLVYDDNGEKITVYKCQQCFKKNPSLANFRKCEVYSRVVGYIRPVNQWHLGKKQEYSERKEYKQV
jgi:anaerobic ribonucleoside-triphosphate reductase